MLPWDPSSLVSPSLLDLIIWPVSRVPGGAVACGLWAMEAPFLPGGSKYRPRPGTRDHLCLAVHCSHLGRKPLPGAQEAEGQRTQAFRCLCLHQSLFWLNPDPLLFFSSVVSQLGPHRRSFSPSPSVLFYCFGYDFFPLLETYLPLIFQEFL